MFWNKYLVPSVILLSVLSFLNEVALKSGFYYTLGWYDWVMHFLGGLSVALLLLWIADLSGADRFSRLATPRNLVLAVLAIGIAWEIFELSSGLTNFSDKGYAWDTTHDLIMDVLGGFVAALLLKKSRINR